MRLGKFCKLFGLIIPFDTKFHERHGQGIGPVRRNLNLQNIFRASTSSTSTLGHSGVAGGGFGSSMPVPPTPMKLKQSGRVPSNKHSHFIGRSCGEQNPPLDEVTGNARRKKLIPRLRRFHARAADVFQSLAHHVGADKIAFLGRKLVGVLFLQMRRLRDDEKFVHERTFHARK